MLSWLAKQILSRNMAHLRAGDYRPLLRGDAKDVRFRFPGDSSWATELQGKQELKGRLQRFVTLACRSSRTRSCSKGGPRETIYNNRYVIWGHMSWGLVKDYEVYEDTQKSAALDQYLAARAEQVNRRSGELESTHPA